MCSNCKGGFYPPITCGGCNTGCCPGITFPCVFGASVNNPGCECCKEKTPPGKCKWPCMWPCCCTCTPPKFEFKPLKPKPVCHCPSPHSHHTACGHHCLKRTGLRLSRIPTLYCPISHNIILWISVFKIKEYSPCYYCFQQRTNSFFFAKGIFLGFVRNACKHNHRNAMEHVEKNSFILTAI